MMLMLRMFQISDAFASSSFCRDNRLQPHSSSILRNAASSSFIDIDEINNHDNKLEVLMDLLMPTKDCDVSQLSAITLAYIGDAVFELFVVRVFHILDDGFCANNIHRPLFNFSD